MSIRFKKEIIIIFFILVFVLGMEFITSKITQKSLEKIKSQISELEKMIKENDEKENTLEKLQKIAKEWDKIENYLAFFTEHNELEKIREDIVSMKANLESGEISDFLEKVSHMKFRLECVQNKQKMKWNHIF